MTWQDVVIAVGQFLFVIALVPALRAPEKPPLKTSLSTGIVLTSFVYVFLTLGLWLAVLSSLLSAGAWLVLAIQRMRAQR